MKKQRIVFAVVLAVCAVLTGCLSSSAVDDFAKVSAQAATLFPAVASIPYNGCVAIEKNTQLANQPAFDPAFTFKQADIDTACKAAKDTSDRLTKTYAVLAAYITTLDKLAGGNTPTYDKSLPTSIPGMTSTQASSVTKLVGLIADLVDKGYRKKKAADAIHQAQPWVHELSTMLHDQLPPYLNLYIKNENDSLGSMYRDIAMFKINDVNYRTSPILVTSGFVDKQAVIQQQQTAVSAFEVIFAKIDEGHTALDKSRNKLWDKATIQELFQTASSIKTQVDAIESAFKPSAPAAAKK